MRELTFAQALNEAIRQQMEKDERVFLIGEDIASGIFAVTQGLVEKFGKERRSEPDGVRPEGQPDRHGLHSVGGFSSHQ